MENRVFSSKIDQMNLRCNNLKLSKRYSRILSPFQGVMRNVHATIILKLKFCPVTTFWAINCTLFIAVASFSETIFYLIKDIMPKFNLQYR